MYYYWWLFCMNFYSFSSFNGLYKYSYSPLAFFIIIIITNKDYNIEDEKKIIEYMSIYFDIIVICSIRYLVIIINFTTIFQFHTIESKLFALTGHFVCTQMKVFDIMNEKWTKCTFFKSICSRLFLESIFGIPIKFIFIN